MVLVGAHFHRMRGTIVLGGAAWVGVSVWGMPRHSLVMTRLLSHFRGNSLPREQGSWWQKGGRIAGEIYPSLVLLASRAKSVKQQPGLNCGPVSKPLLVLVRALVEISAQNLTIYIFSARWK